MVGRSRSTGPAVLTLELHQMSFGDVATDLPGRMLPRTPLVCLAEKAPGEKAPAAAPQQERVGLELD